MSADNGLAAYVAVQPLYNLLERAYESDVMPMAVEHDLATFPYSVLASGFLTGKYRPGVEVASARARGSRSTSTIVVTA